MNQIVLKIGRHQSEFYFPQNETGFSGIREVIMDICSSNEEAEKAVCWCKSAFPGDKYKKERFSLLIRA